MRSRGIAAPPTNGGLARPKARANQQGRRGGLAGMGRAVVASQPRSCAWMSYAPDLSTCRLIRRAREVAVRTLLGITMLAWTCGCAATCPPHSQVGLSHPDPGRPSGTASSGAGEGLAAILVPHLSSSGAYHLGSNTNRYSDRCTVEIRARDCAEGVEYVISYNMDRHASQELCLTINAHERRLHGSIRGGTHLTGPIEWSDIFGVVAMDQWPTSASDPVSVHFMVGGRVNGAVPCFSDWFAIER